MKIFYLISLIFLLISCSKHKTVLICGDHVCINKAEARQYFDNLKLETIYGPMPSQVSKLKGRYKHLIYIQFSSRSQLHKEINKFLLISEKWSTLKKVKAMIDIDPNNFY